MNMQGFQVIQFVHPGFEYHRREHVGKRQTLSGVMEWKPGKEPHDRKFMLTGGSLFDGNIWRDQQDVPIGFWGEWEGPSVFWRVKSPGKPLPKIVHAPFRPARPPTHSVQNTDPMVFGDAFIYSNCLQAPYASLRTLNPGSIVLFGRYGRVNGQHSFSLDTCLVIDRFQILAPVPPDPETYGRNLLMDAVLTPLHTEGADLDLTVYFGNRRSPDSESPFSFFPARLMDDSPPLFARPELRPTGALETVINPAKMQGIKVTSQLTPTDRDAIWAEVVQQVTRQDCGLGFHAYTPPILEPGQAESASRRNPAPLRM